MLLPPRKLPAWVNEAATEAERQLTGAGTEAATAGSSESSESAAIGESR